jgi:hypothetical protein
MSRFSLQPSQLARFVVPVLLPLLAGCGKRDSWHETRVEIDRIEVVRKDAQGNARDIDIEFSYPDCPGDQSEIIRGDAAFAACIQKQKQGDTVPVRILRHWDPKGFWDWDIQTMAGCPRPPDPDDEASFDNIEECEETLVNGVNEGFVCNRIPQKALLSKCPWFARH